MQTAVNKTLAASRLSGSDGRRCSAWSRALQAAARAAASQDATGNTWFSAPAAG